MRETPSSQLRLVVIELWLGVTIVLLLTATASSLRDPSLMIYIGMIGAKGLSAVFATTLPAICGIAALLGLFQRRTSASVPLLLYSLFWLVLLGGGMLEEAWSAGLAGISRLNAHTWLVGGVMYAVMISGFLIMAHWSIRHLSERRPRATDS
ncbi:MAG: hypothetical protein KGL59_11470 [Acidobacteriota bacterium]|nr:hypothetical protein [Acidobacteriota bacterium]